MTEIQNNRFVDTIAAYNDHKEQQRHIVRNALLHHNLLHTETVEIYPQQPIAFIRTIY